MKKMMKKFLVPMVATLCMALLITGVAPVKAYAAAAPASKKMISTTGEATVAVTPDMAVLTLGVQSTDKDVKAAYNDNKTKMDAILKELANLGIEKKDIKTTTFTVNPNYDWADGSSKLTGYTVTNMVTVTIRDLDKVGTVLESAILQNSNAINGLEYKVADNSKSYKAALRLAIRNAKEKATEMADELGYKKVTAVSVRENSISEGGPVYFDKAMLANAGAPVSRGTVEIKATVSVDFQY